MLKPTKKMENKRYMYLTLVISLFRYGMTKGADQTAHPRRLVCSFVVLNQQSHGFSHRAPYDVEAQASWPLSG